MSKFQTSPIFNNLMEDVAVSPTDVYMNSERLTTRPTVMSHAVTGL